MGQRQRIGFAEGATRDANPARTTRNASPGHT